MIDQGPRQVRWGRREVVPVEGEDEDKDEDENTAVGVAAIISETHLLENRLVKNGSDWKKLSPSPSPSPRR